MLKIRKHMAVHGRKIMLREFLNMLWGVIVSTIISFVFIIIPVACFVYFELPIIITIIGSIICITLCMLFIRVLARLMAEWEWRHRR